MIGDDCASKIPELSYDVTIGYFFGILRHTYLKQLPWHHPGQPADMTNLFF